MNTTIQQKRISELINSQRALICQKYATFDANRTEQNRIQYNKQIQKLEKLQEKYGMIEECSF